MGLNSKERFENHMDIASPEMVGDAEKIEYIEEDVEDDMFEKRLLATPIKGKIKLED